VNLVPFAQFPEIVKFPVTAPELGIYFPKFRLVALILQSAATFAVTVNVVAAVLACVISVPVSNKEMPAIANHDRLNFIMSLIITMVHHTLRGRKGF